MSNSLKVTPGGVGQATLSLYPPVDIPEGTPKHKRRKLLRAGVCHLVIPRSMTVDLVEKSGLSVAVLEKLPEVKNAFAKGSLKRVIEEPLSAVLPAVLAETEEEKAPPVVSTEKAEEQIPPVVKKAQKNKGKRKK